MQQREGTVPYCGKDPASASWVPQVLFVIKSHGKGLVEEDFFALLSLSPAL